MKIKAIFQNSFKTKKTLSYTDIFQEKKTIQGVSMKSDGEEHTCANHRRHSRTQPWMNLPSWQKAKFKSRLKVANKIILFQIHISRPEAVPKLFPDVLTLVKYFIVESCCESSLACLFKAPGGKMSSSSLEG